MYLLHRLARRQHPLTRAPRMDFRLEQTSFDSRIVLHQPGRLLRSHAENLDTSQLTLIIERERSRNGQASLL